MRVCGVAVGEAAGVPAGSAGVGVTWGVAVGDGAADGVVVAVGVATGDAVAVAAADGVGLATDTVTRALVGVGSGLRRVSSTGCRGSSQADRAAAKSASHRAARAILGRFRVMRKAQCVLIAPTFRMPG